MRTSTKAREIANEDLKDPRMDMAMPSITDWANGDLPEDIRHVIGFPDDTPVVAWTSCDSQLPGSALRDSLVVIGAATMSAFCTIFLFFGFFFSPVYFALVLLILVFGLPSLIVRHAVSKHHFWVLTCEQLYIVSRRHDLCASLPGFLVAGNRIISMTLENVMDCYVVESAALFGVEFPRQLYVSTVSRPATPPHKYEYTIFPPCGEYIGMNLSNAKGFMEAVKNHASLIKNQGRPFVPDLQA
jgi:hypothetical protein